VFLSSGGDAIDSMVGQIARALGAGRVVGSTRSRENADRPVAEFGYVRIKDRGWPKASRRA
jgi:NADPH-dependent curcumin reductase CurA